MSMETQKSRENGPPVSEAPKNSDDGSDQNDGTDEMAPLAEVGMPTGYRGGMDIPHRSTLSSLPEIDLNAEHRAAPDVHGESGVTDGGEVDPVRLEEVGMPTGYRGGMDIPHRSTLSSLPEIDLNAERRAAPDDHGESGVTDGGEVDPVRLEEVGMPTGYRGGMDIPHRSTLSSLPEIDLNAEHRAAPDVHGESGKK